MSLTRRAFLGTAFAAAPALARAAEKRFLVSLSFDDGFRKSFTRTAELYEKFERMACFNVMAGAQLPGFKSPDRWIKNLGGFPLWNELQKRGHEIMPHSLRHANLGKMPVDEAKVLILECLEIFDQELKGFDRKQAVFNFPYNSSNAELERWILTEVRAFRAGGKWVNALPKRGVNRLSCTGSGPKNCEGHLDQHLEKLFKQPSGWLIYNLHGLDEEGWGPIRASYLERLLARLTAMDEVEVIPVGAALRKYA